MKFRKAISCAEQQAALLSLLRLNPVFPPSQAPQGKTSRCVQCSYVSFSWTERIKKCFTLSSLSPKKCRFCMMSGVRQPQQLKGLLLLRQIAVDAR